jgi:ketosteroid isomerase-like protein
MGRCFAIGVVLAAVGCWSPAPPSPSATWSVQSQEQRAEGQVQIRHLLRTLEVAESEADMKALEALYVPDARWLPPEGPLIEGRDAILAQYRSMYAEMEVKLLLSAESIGVTPTAGQVLGWAGLTLTPRSGDGQGEQIYRFRLVLQRNAEGIWQIGFLQWWPWANLEDGPERLPEGVLPSGEPEIEASGRSAALDDGGANTASGRFCLAGTRPRGGISATGVGPGAVRTSATLHCAAPAVSWHCTSGVGTISHS